MSDSRMESWWNSPGTNQSAWCAVVNADAPIESDMVKNFSPKLKSGEPDSWVSFIADAPTAAPGSTVTWRLMPAFEAFLRAKCTS